MITDDNKRDELKSYLDALVSKRRLGFAWLDRDLVVRECFGDLSDWIPRGENICEATPLFWGMETEILHLQDEPDEAVIIPKVGLKKDQGDDQTKLSVEITWVAEEEKYIVSLYNISSQSDLDHELAKQVKARRIAEENYQNAKRRVNEQQGLLELIMDHAPAAVAIFDHQMRFQFTTKNWLQLFAMEREPVIGRSFYDICPDRNQDRNFHQQCLEGKHITLEIERVRNGNGQMEWVRLDLQPWRHDNGTIGGIIIVADVLTELIEKRKELEQKNKDLARANQELEEFTSIVSHDLQSPLRAIKSEAQALKDNVSNDDMAAVDRIVSQSERMSSMLSDLFEYSHIHRRSDKVQVIDIEKTIADIVENIPETGNFTVNCNILVQQVELPLAPFDLVLRNLLENAINHHDQDNGSINIRVDEQESSWEFQVGDDGPGVPVDMHSVIFQPFYTGHSRHSWAGNGIGLALVKKTIELHGGDIKILSDPDQKRGTIFLFTWPKIEKTL